MSALFKPMLAGTPQSDADARFPMLASPKLDGIRAACKDRTLLSRSLKLIPNKLVQSVLSLPELHGLDGELVVGPANAPNVMQATTSIVMSIEKIVPFEYHVFDFWDSREGFHDRLAHAEHVVLSATRNWLSLMTAARLEGAPAFIHECPIRMVPHRMAHNLDELAAFEAEMLELGYEGIMGRHPNGAYKFGRSTVREGGLLKFKRFTDGEAIIVGFEEEMKNGNAAQTNELGRTKRSTAKAGLTGKGTLGAFVCKRLTVNAKGVLVTSDLTFNIGTGMDAALRQRVWERREAYMNGIVKFKHFEHGVVDAPRHPVFIGFRDIRDMS